MTGARLRPFLIDRTVGPTYVSPHAIDPRQRGAFFEAPAYTTGAVRVVPGSAGPRVEEMMGKQITVTFDKDIPEAQLDELREKIRKVLRGEAVPEAEVVGQWAGGDPGNVGSVPGLR